MKIVTAIFLFSAVIFCRAQDAITPVALSELFNGRTFDGFTFCMKNDADPMATWSVTNGLIHCTGTPAGYLRTTQAYSNCVITVIWPLALVDVFTPISDDKLCTASSR